MKKRKANRWTRRALFAGVALGLYTVTGFLVAPAVIKWQIGKQVPALTHRQVKVETVRVNPYALSLTIRGLALTEPDGQPFASVGEFYVNFESVSLFKRRWQFRAIRLVAPSLTVKIDADGTPNFANLLPPSTNTAATSAPLELPPLPRVVATTIAITGGSLDVTHNALAKPFHHRIDPIDVTLSDFSTLPDRDRPYSFTAQTPKGETFAWSGDISINPIRSEGTITCRNVDIPQYVAFLPPSVQVRIDSGLVDVGGHYHLTLEQDMDLTVTNFAVQVRNLKAADVVTGKPLLELPDYAVRELVADLRSLAVTIGSVSISNGVAFVERKSDGTTNLKDLGDLSPLLRLMEGWKVQLDDLKIDNFTLHADDKDLPREARVTLDQVGVHLQNISNATNAVIPIALSFRWNNAGTVRVDGQATLLPVTAALDVHVDEFDLRPLQPYAEPFANVALTNGAIRLKGHVSFDPQATDGQLIRFEGETGVAHLAVHDTILNRELLTLDDVAVTGISAVAPTIRVHVDKIAVTGAGANVVRDSEGRINVLQLLKPRATTDSVPPSPAAATNTVAAAAVPPPFVMDEVTVGEVILDKVALRVADEAVAPAFHSVVRDVRGTISGLSSKELARADVNLQGRVNDSPPFTVTGTINPLTTNLFTDLTMQLQDMPLVSGSPYAGKYAGFPIEGGTVTLDLNYRVSQTELKAENQIVVSNLQLGSATGSPNATKLPVKLGVALLTDIKGQIVLDVPVRGNLNDPEFRLGRVILHTLTSLIVKASTSPFNLLGSIIGADAPDLTYIAFAPGSTEPSGNEANKFQLLTKVLTERPSLKLVVTGTIDPEADRDALAREKLLLVLKEKRLKEQPIQTMRGVTPDQVQLDQANYERLLKQHYIAVTGATVATERPANLRSVPIPKRPAKKTDAMAGPTVQEMEQALIAPIAVAPEELADLRRQRARVVLDRLTQESALVGRALIAPESETDAAAELPAKPRAALRLDI